MRRVSGCRTALRLIERCSRQRHVRRVAIPVIDALCVSARLTRLFAMRKMSLIGGCCSTRLQNLACELASIFPCTKHTAGGPKSLSARIAGGFTSAIVAVGRCYCTAWFQLSRHTVTVSGNAVLGRYLFFGTMLPLQRTTRCPRVRFCWREGTRTPGLSGVNTLLYQLSYTPSERTRRFELPTFGSASRRSLH